MSQGVRGVEFVLGDLLRIAGGDEEEADKMVRCPTRGTAAARMSVSTVVFCYVFFIMINGITLIEQMWRSYTTNTTAARLGWGGLCAASLIFVDTNHHGKSVVIPSTLRLVLV
jgi:hypothetical protein